MERYCRDCGHELSVGDRFCPNCGKPAHETAHVPTPEADVSVPPPGQFGTPSFAPQPAGPTSGGFTAGKVLAGCGGVVVLLFLFVGCVALIAQGGGESADSTPAEERRAASQEKKAPPAEEEPVEEEAQPAEEEASPANDNPPKEDKKKTYAVGEEVRVGDVSYKVKEAWKTQQLEDRYNIDPPKTGNFVVVNFQFTNNGGEPVNMSDIGMYVYDGQGRQFETDSDTFGYIPEDKDILLLERINPGMSQDAQIIYSVPPDASGLELEVSSGFWQTETARINLGI